MAHFLMSQFPAAVPIFLKDICVNCCPVLAHNEYMTDYLQRNRACTLHIKKIAQDYDGECDALIRHIQLNDEHHYTHVIAKIRITLKAFSKTVRDELIEDNRPLGRILMDTQVKPILVDRFFFRIHAPVAQGPSSTQATCNDMAYTAYPFCRAHQSVHFGRAHTLLDGYGQQLAEVCEWLA